MSIGLPEVLLQFKQKAVSAIERSARGIVALVLKDDTVSASLETAKSYKYKTIDEIVATDWSAENLNYIQMVMAGGPALVLVERVATTDTNYDKALTRLKTKKWNWLAIPSLTDSETPLVATWIKQLRNNEHKTFKAVLANVAADDKGIVNFCTSNVQTTTSTYTAQQFCARIAGALAGLSLDRSFTGYVFPEVLSVKASLDANVDINAGKLILLDRGGVIKVARGVNSLTTFTPTQSEDMRRIKIVEGMDLYLDDIRDTFEANYLGKVINSYNNKMLFIGSLKAYQNSLKGNVLDENDNSEVDVDVEAHRQYLQSRGTDPSGMTIPELRAANTGGKMFITSKIKFVDAAEDLVFTAVM